MSFFQNLYKNVKEIVVLLVTVFIVRTFIFGLYIVPTGSMETTLLVGEQLVANKAIYWFKNPDYNEIIACNQPVLNYSENFLEDIYQRYFSLNTENWTKRIIGKPGDTIKGVIEDGHPVIYRNGAKIDEPYVNKNPLVGFFNQLPSFSNNGHYTLKTYDPSLAGDKQLFYKKTDHRKIVKQLGAIMSGTPVRDGKDEYEITLKDDEYWILGDNRLGSHDSRFFGPVKRKLIHGKIVFRLLSFDDYEIDITKSGIASLLNLRDWTVVKFVLHPIDFINNVRWSRCFQFVY